MTDTIREQIIANFVTKLADIRTANGYNSEAGQLVKRVRKNFDPDDIPAIGVWPLSEEAGRAYGGSENIMPMKIIALKEFGTTNPSDVAEELLGDLIECVLGIEWTLPFTSGGTYEVEVGDTVEGVTDGAEGYVIAVDVSSGTWAGGDAEGTLTLHRVTGTFNISEDLRVGVDSNVAETDGATTGESGITTTTDDLANDIEYVEGGVDEYPEENEIVVGVFATFNVKYRTLTGDPYNQPAT